MSLLDADIKFALARIELSIERRALFSKAELIKMQMSADDQMRIKYGWHRHSLGQIRRHMAAQQRRDK